MVGLAELEVGEWPKDVLLSSNPAQQALCREARPLADFASRRRKISEKLAEFGGIPISDAEFIAARLWTGPMFMKYTTVLRGIDGQARYYASSFEALCRGNTYRCTLHSLNTALRRLSVLQKSAPVFRLVLGAL